MKKLMIMAVVALMTTSAMAQNPDALKQIKKCKTPADAEALIKQNEASMTAQENAQAYNKLVDLYLVPVSKIDAAIAESQITGKQAEYDKNQYAADIMNACNAAIACDKYDIQPNEKGKVSPKFRKSNANRLYNYRIHMIIAGQDYLQAEKYAESAPLFYSYAETGYAPMFADVVAAQEKAGQKDQYLGQTIDTAARLYTQIKQFDMAAKCGDILAKDPDPKTQDFGITVKMNAIQATAKNHADSLEALNKMKEVYQQYPNNAMAFTFIAQMQSALGMDADQAKFVDEFIAKNPKAMTAYLFKAQNLMNAKKYDESIATFTKALECETSDPLQKAYAYTYRAYCYIQQAAVLDKVAEQKPFLEKAAADLEEARKIDPNRERANWAYPLYQCYYQLYGENDERTKEVASVAGM